MGYGRRGSPGNVGHRGTTPKFQQRHYEAIAEELRLAFQRYPKGTPENSGICVVANALIKMFETDNEKFRKFTFIEWMNKGLHDEVRHTK